MSSGADAFFQPVSAARSRALERRLRRRRREAHIRLRLIADAALLSGHHAGQAPHVDAPAAMAGSNAAGQLRLDGLQLQFPELRQEVATLRCNLGGFTMDFHGCQNNTAASATGPTATLPGSDEIAGHE